MFYNFFSIYRNGKQILYYQNHNERLQKKVRERYQNLSEEEKNKRQKKAQERHQNFTEEEKKKKASVLL